jgi:hypothetical protein
MTPTFQTEGPDRPRRSFFPNCPSECKKWCVSGDQARTPAQLDHSSRYQSYSLHIRPLIHEVRSSIQKHLIIHPRAPPNIRCHGNFSKASSMIRYIAFGVHRPSRAMMFEQRRLHRQAIVIFPATRPFAKFLEKKIVWGFYIVKANTIEKMPCSSLRDSVT